MYITEDVLQDDLLDTRGKPITCKYCHHSFKFESKKQKEQWKIDDYICPLCSELWCILPPTERKLKYLQDQYLKTRTESDLVNMLRLMYPYTCSLIKKNFKKALKFEGALEYYANEVIIIMTEEYLRKLDFRLDISFGSFIIIKARQAIYNPKQFIDQHISLDFTFDDGNNLHELIPDTKKTIIDHIEQQEDEKLLHNKIVYLIENISDYCKDEYEDYIRTVSLYAYLKKGEIAFDKIFQAFGRKGKEISMKTLDIIREELKKEIIYYNEPEDKKIKHSKIKVKNNMLLNIKDLNGISWDLEKKKTRRRS